MCRALKARLRTVDFIPNALGPEAPKQGSDIPCLTFPAAPLLMDGGWIAGRPEGRLNKPGGGGEAPAGSRVRDALERVVAWGLGRSRQI